ncbi:hypothetical protein [Saccharothrix sp. 6-C]|uniref:hypothetical protein n=1 Tax=Saccharothrix sp. 6-C TaxID=2781735 RepID=UPI002E2BB674|nr:hypothetical protein [Saccharothrix sp. 6-C]
MAALDVQVTDDRRGEGIAAEALTFLRQSVHERGLSRLVIPVRPTTKDRLPSSSMEQFLGRRRPDGSSADPWVRAHERLGGQFVKVAPFSMTIVGSLAQWQSWTGSSLVEGANVVDGALAPVLASTELDVGVYVEPNVWMEHTVGQPESADGG